jgi:hypothetical protein
MEKICYIVVMSARKL